MVAGPVGGPTGGPANVRKSRPEAGAQAIQPQSVRLTLLQRMRTRISSPESTSGPGRSNQADPEEEKEEEQNAPVSPAMARCTRPESDRRSGAAGRTDDDAGSSGAAVIQVGELAAVATSTQSALRATAHPVRLQILSLLTGAEMSAAEIARELGIGHANASYHLRFLADADLVVEAGEERIRGGVAKRYRHPWDAAETAGAVDSPEDAARYVDALARAGSFTHI